MSSRTLKRSRHVSSILVFTAWLGTATGAQLKPKDDISNIPAKVMKALRARFPNPVIRTWTQATEGGIVLYDIEFKQGSRNFEADIREDGTIDNWEREIPVVELPDGVRKTIGGKYPGAIIKQVMAVTVVKDGQDMLEGYEVTLVTRDKKAAELTIAPDGKVLEDSAYAK